MTVLRDGNGNLKEPWEEWELCPSGCGYYSHPGPCTVEDLL